ncbi:MAG: T9SS type A sorting domain-containing protein [Chitinophagaceae bacterium]|nr:T9SS type A sorting domain-containing protein [Chitinophagaceae bacterium]
MKKIFVLFLAIWLVKPVMAQNTSPSLVSFGKPFVAVNIVDLNIVIPSVQCNDKTAVLIDLGELDNQGNPINCFKVMFVDLISKNCQSVNVKDVTENTVITSNIGKPNVWTIGMDGNIYVGTSGGGHIVRINARSRKVEDLGLPINLIGQLSITKLSIGTDFTINGAILQEGTGTFVFNYGYNCNFKTLSNQIINLSYPNIKDITNDTYFTYVVCQSNNNELKLYKIHNITLVLDEVVNMFPNNTIPSSLDAYLGDQVYGTVDNGNASPLLFKLNSTYTELLSAVQITSPLSSVLIKPKNVWKSLYTNYVGFNTSFNVNDKKLYYTSTTISGSVDLSSCIQIVSRPTRVFAPYYNAITGNYELFIHGSQINKAASLNYMNKTLNLLGDNNVPYLQAYSAITSFDNQKVYIGGSNYIQTYNSNNNWNNTGTNPANTFTTGANPLLTNNRLWGASKMVKMNTAQLLVTVGTNGGNRGNTMVQADETSLLIINPSTGVINDIYRPQFSQFLYGHKALAVDQKNEKILVIGNNQNVSVGGKFAHLMVLNTTGNIELELDIVDENNNPIYEIMNLEADSTTLYFYKANVLYRIPNYTLTGAKAERVYFNSYNGIFRAIGLSTNKQFITLASSNGNNDVQILIIPVESNNLTFYPENMGNIIIVNGTITAEESSNSFPFEFAFTDDYCFLSGYTSVWGFQFEGFETGVYSNKHSYASEYVSNSFFTSKNVKALQVIPNPTSSNITAFYTSNKNETIAIQIYDSKGIMYVNKYENAMPGKNQFNIITSKLAKGSYYIKITGKEGIITSKFIKL